MASSGSILTDQLFNNSIVTAHGTYSLYTSAQYNIPQSDTALEVSIEYSNLLPGRDAAPLNYSFSALLESQDDNGNWYTFHNQFEPVRGGLEPDQLTHRLIINPQVFVLEPGRTIDISNGVDIIVKESPKQGVAPDDFRLTIILNEFGYNTPGAFQNVTISATYKTFSL